MDHFTEILILVVAVSLGKGLIFAGIARIFHYGNVIPMAVGLGMFQIGEFSFVLARIGVATNSITQELFSLVLTTTVVTMVLTPLVSGLTSRFYALKKRYRKQDPLETINIPKTGLHGHVIIAGYGRIGSQVAHVLQGLKLPFVVIELDQYRVDKAKENGVPVIYGDSCNDIVLEAAYLSSAALVLLTMPDIVHTREVATQIRRVRPRLPIVARTSDKECLGTFSDLHITDVVMPEFEAGLEMTRKTLAYLHIPAPRIHHYTESLRKQLFASLPEQTDEYTLLQQLKSAEHLFELQWVTIEGESPLADRTLGEADIRQTTGTSVVGVVRNQEVTLNPGASFRVQPGDMVALIGTDQAREIFFKTFLPGSSSQLTIKETLECVTDNAFSMHSG